MTRLLPTALLVLFLCACGPVKKDPPPQVVAVDKSVAYECGEPPKADPFKARPVKWGVDSLASGVKVFTLTGAMYENLMTNLVNSATSAQQVRKQRDFYAECVARSQNRNAPAPPPAVEVRAAPGPAPPTPTLSAPKP